ncbi:DUF1501 domain-containing protein [Verrucomicrobiales bacterium]|nr:DUF1501 domain-containing protein [Verrucomicrobiales bacterium]MDA9922886.1 DUF1501 domain-containing protein [Verrucomicrobiales bacterium]MDC3352582.1 DUF1501 domain-containing protein [Verrucomicrobiales bacterium]
MSRFCPNLTPCNRTRREFLGNLGGGFAGLALADLLHAESGAGSPHFAPKASRAVFLFMNGGPSQVDTFDPKPELDRLDGMPYGGDAVVGSNGRPIGHLMKSPFAFKNHGKSGLPISELFPHTAKHADDICVIRSLHSDTAAHASGCLQMNTGAISIGKPALGSWVNYGLGSANRNLPGFVVMTDPRGGPIGSASNWSSGFMPATHQGTLFRSKGSPLLDLATPEGTSDQTQRRGLDLLKDLNAKHLVSRPEMDELAARIESYELAYRMQSEATEVVDLDRIDAKTKTMYGMDNPLTADFGRKCLITKQLLERGVRFIQLYSGGGHIEETWDGHTNCITNHKLHAGETDQAIGALMTDLKRSGLWDETLLIWGGEFGRTPTSEGVGKFGRDHNWQGYSMWLAGAGVKGGQAIGATDEVGFKAVEDPHHISDVHATILHLMGLDHKRLTFYHQGLDQRLTGVTEERHVIREALA